MYNDDQSNKDILEIKNLNIDKKIKIIFHSYEDKFVGLLKDDNTIITSLDDELSKIKFNGLQKPQYIAEII